jgi:hypothetical protein
MPPPPSLLDDRRGYDVNGYSLGRVSTMACVIEPLRPALAASRVGSVPRWQRPALAASRLPRRRKRLPVGVARVHSAETRYR